MDFGLASFAIALSCSYYDIYPLLDCRIVDDDLKSKADLGWPKRLPDGPLAANAGLVRLAVADLASWCLLLLFISCSRVDLW